MKNVFKVGKVEGSGCFCAFPAQRGNVSVALGIYPFIMDPQTKNPRFKEL